MKNAFVFIVCIVIASFLIFRSMKFRVFVKPFIRRKCDGFGCGNFGASRDGGNRKHMGMDVLTKQGQPVFAPFGGTIRNFKAYENDSSLDGVQIQGNTFKVKLMYVQPARENGAKVNAGDVIGWAQSLQPKYPGISDHIHCEVWAYGKALNPDTYFPKDTIFQV